MLENSDPAQEGPALRPALDRSAARPSGNTMRRVLFRLTLICCALALLAALGLALALWLAPRPALLDDTAFSRLFTDRAGAPLRLTLTPDGKYRLFTPLDDCPGELIEATLLYEDRAFFRHPGVNPLSLARAALHMAGGGRRMGGSTITMQVARLIGGLNTTTPRGKLIQIWRALVLERHHDKARILEAYLNLAPYGANVEGVGAAALVYFHKTAARLTLPEALALAPVPQHPAARNPLAARGKALSAARLRLHALWNARHPKDAGPFGASPLQVYGPKDLPWEAPHAVDSLLRDAATLAWGSVRTTLDLPVQRLVQRTLCRAVERGRPRGLDNAAALLLDWRSGEIRALVGSADFFDARIQGQVDGTAARRSPGSTLKPFVYALALEQGLIHPQTVLRDTRRSFRGYDPENADGTFRGPLSARLALRASRNIPAIALADQLAPPGLYGFLRRAGVQFEHSAGHYGLALVLGGAEISMRELGGLYAALAHQGLWRPPALLPRPDTPPLRLLSPEAAFIALDMLRAPAPTGAERVRACWKTGTSNGRRDAWTAGICGPYALVVWVGHFDGRPDPNLSGLDAAAPLFFDLVRALDGHSRLRDTTRRPDPDLNLARIPVCAATGDTDTSLCPGPLNPDPDSAAAGPVETWFIPGVSPIRASGILRPLLLDPETGLRQCVERPGRTKRVIWECWPGDIRRLFRQAGIHKPPPPPWAPECPQQTGAPGKAPAIVSPRAGVTYTARLSAPGRLPLLADADPDADAIFWFAGTRFLGQSAPDTPLFWQPVPGLTTLRAVDSEGRAATLRVRVDSAP